MAMPTNIEGLSVADRATLRELTKAQGQAVHILIRQSSYELNQAYETKIRETATDTRQELSGSFNEIAGALVEIRQSMATVQRNADHVQKTNENQEQWINKRDIEVAEKFQKVEGELHKTNEAASKAVMAMERSEVVAEEMKTTNTKANDLLANIK